MLGQEGPGGCKVLPVHDLGDFVDPITLRPVLVGQTFEGGVKVGQLAVVTRLAQLVHVAGRLYAIAQGRIGVVSQPIGRLHDVGVGVVDKAVFDIRHGRIIIRRHGACNPAL